MDASVGMVTRLNNSFKRYTRAIHPHLPVSHHLGSKTQKFLPIYDYCY